jgi:hypothetical protein
MSDSALESLSADDRKRLRRWAEKMRRAKRLFEHRRWEDLSDDDKKTLAWLEERLHTKWLREDADVINAFLVGMGAPAAAPPATASRRDSTETIYTESDTASDAGSHITVDGGDGAQQRDAAEGPINQNVERVIVANRVTTDLGAKDDCAGRAPDCILSRLR